MTISKIRATLGRLIRGVPADHPGAVGATPAIQQPIGLIAECFDALGLPVDDGPLPRRLFVRESQLPLLPLIAAEAAAPFRVDATGETWFSISADDDDDTIEATVDSDDDDQDFDDFDFDDDDQDFDAADDDSTIGPTWSDEIDAEGYPCDYPRSWRSR